MNWRHPRPKVPDVDDNRRKMAELLYADSLVAAKAGEPPDPDVRAALDWIGYRDWVLPHHGYTPPDSPLRRRQMLDALRGKPYITALTQIILDIGWTEPPDRECEKRFDLAFDRYVEIRDGVLHWGLKETMERDLIFHMRYDILRLEVHDRGDVIRTYTIRPREDGWDNSFDMVEEGLADDDYRFMFWCMNSGGTENARSAFDMAIVEGEWRRLSYQGYDWDGESE